MIATDATLHRSQFMPPSVPTKSPRRGPPEPKPTLANQVQLLDVERIAPHPDNPREEFSDRDPELLELADSLREHKLIQPICVVPAGDGAHERFTIVCGERRWRAAKLAGWRVIPGFILGVSPQEALQLLVEENVCRKDFNPIEHARAFAVLVKPTAEGGAGWKHAKVGQKYGRSRPWVHNMLKLLELPAEWQKRIASGDLGFRQAQRLAVYADRPDVLKAVELDRDANPQDWALSADFDRQLAAIVARLDGLADASASPGGPGCSPASIDPADAAGDGPTALPLRRRAAPVDHAQPLESTLDEQLDAELATDPEALLRRTLKLAALLDAAGLDRLAKYVAERRRKIVA